MFTDFYHSFYYIIIILAALLSLILIKRSDAAFKFLAALIVLTLISEFTVKYMSATLKMNSNIVYHIFTVVEFVLYTLVYSRLFGSAKWNSILVSCVGIMVVATILNVIFLQPLKITPTNTMILESILLILISLGFFNKIKESTEVNLFRAGFFWFNSAVLLFYAFNILVWGFHSIKVYQMKAPPTFIYSLLLLFSALLYIAFSYALILNVKNKKAEKVSR